MSGRTRTFRRTDGGELRAFTADGRDCYTATPNDAELEEPTDHFYQDANGFRIDQMPDGTFEDKWGVTWLPELPPSTPE
jgi:hypothetical protein